MQFIPGMFWAFALANIALSFCLSYLATEVPRDFQLDALQTQCYYQFLTLLIAFLLTQAFSRPELFWPIAVLMTGANLLTQIVDSSVYSHLLPRWAEHDAQLRWGYFIVSLLWWSLILYQILSALLHQSPWTQRATLATYVVILTALPSIVLTPKEFWNKDYYAEYLQEQTTKSTPLVAEEIFGQQAALLSKALKGLAAGQQGKPELYFLAVGPYGRQDVFLKEVLYTTQQFKERFATSQRSLALVNNRKKVDELPLASVSNMDAALRAIGRRMNPDEDILFLFLTSHGSRNGELSVELEGLSFRPLTAPILAELLQQAGIRWKVIVVSGCYSGSFITSLKNEHTLVMTAAREDRTSFGCDDEAEFTYFGRAYFEQALNQTDSFIEAFEKARHLVAEWETRDKFTHSEPQIASHPDIERKLAKWRASLTTKRRLPQSVPAASMPPSKSQ
ncbi:MAG: C13 family peptidase [Nevskiales bacterium]